jgi:hypothetical protein
MLTILLIVASVHVTPLNQAPVTSSGRAVLRQRDASFLSVPRTRDPLPTRRKPRSESQRSHPAAGGEKSCDTISTMGFRFRRTFRLLPGLRLNLSKSGVSASVGTRGACLTFGRNGTRTTVGLPGTGISYTTTSSAHEHQSEVARPTRTSAGWLVALLMMLAIAGGVGWLIGVAMR